MALKRVGGGRRADPRCATCGATLEKLGYKHIERIGKLTVTDGTARAWQCTKCGTVALSLNALQRYAYRAAKAALLEGRSTGDVVRYARKALGLTQRELALVLGYQNEAVSRWETGKELMQRTAAHALIGVLCRALDGEEPERMVASAGAVSDGTDEETSEIEVRLRAVG